MGLFTRKTEESDVTVFQVQAEKESVVQVIRQRFYGKIKGKEREASQGSPTGLARKSSHRKLASGGVNAVPSPPSPLAKSYVPELPAKSNQERARATPSLLNDKALPPATPPKPVSPAPKARSAQPATPKKKLSTDAVTASLAQRLNELASANADGLLSDDDYRLLRQDLFERFSGSGKTHVPTEAPMVPAKTHNGHNGSSIDSRRVSTSSRGNSNFQVDLTQRPASRNSLNSGMSSLFRRGSSSRHGSNDFSNTSDTGSLISDAPSKASGSLSRRFSKVLSRKASTSSVGTSTSLQTDTLSLASRRARPSASNDRGGPPHRPLSAAVTKSSSSMRKLASATPPSSFPGKIPGEGLLASNPYEDEDRLKTTSDIRKEISSVEAECRRLMDAFNGLELTTLTKRTRDGHAHSVAGSDFGSEDGGSLYPRVIHGRRDNSDVLSIHSNTSIGTSFSNARSIHSQAPGRRAVTRSRTNTSLSSTAALHALLPVSSSSETPPPSTSSIARSNSRAGSLVRKTSGSSLASGHSRGPSSKALPSLPASSNSVGLGLNLAPPHPSGLPIGSSSRNGSSTSVNVAVPVTRSSGHLPLLPSANRTLDKGDASSMISLANTTTRGRSGSIRSHTTQYNIPEDDTVVMGNTVHDDLEDIKRRRDEVNARYEARLDYLRAKLKSAALHEKLMKK